MKLVVPGGSGQVGTILARAFERRFPRWPEAARDVCAQWRSSRGAGGPNLVV